MTLVDFKKKHKLRLLDLIVLLEKKDTTTDHRGWLIRVAKGEDASDEEDSDEGNVNAGDAAAANEDAYEESSEDSLLAH